MANNGIVRRIDDLGRITIPKEIRRNMKLNDGDALEIIPNYNGKEIVIRPYKKSFEQCAIDWYNGHVWEMDNTYFRVEGDYTFCIVRFIGEFPRAGYAKRFKDDAWDHRVGKVAAFARAMGRNLNKMIGYEG